MRVTAGVTRGGAWSAGQPVPRLPLPAPNSRRPAPAASPDSILPVAELVVTAQALTNSGGAERYMRDLAAGFHRLGIRPTLYARKIDRSLPEAAWVDAQALGVRWAPRKMRNLAFAWLFKRRLRARPDAYVFSVNHPGIADLALCGGTHVGHVETAGRPMRLSDRWQIELERKTYGGAHAIIAHSKRMARELQRVYDVPAERIHVHYPPVETARFRPADPAERLALRRKFGLPEDRTVFVFPSTSHERKGYALLEAFFEKTQLPVCLVVAGRPVPKTGETIRYAGYCKDIEDLFRAADFTVVASVYEPFGLVGVESVLCGTPLVIADNVGSAEAVTGDAKIEFSRDDPASFERAIATALERVRGPNPRVADPVASVVYDPGVDAHVRELCKLMAL
jgi:glycosyltransferase involved in cell wall biosynthesis